MMSGKRGHLADIKVEVTCIVIDAFQFSSYNLFQVYTSLEFAYIHIYLVLTQ